MVFTPPRSKTDAYSKTTHRKIQMSFLCKLSNSKTNFQSTIKDDLKFCIVIVIFLFQFNVIFI